MAKRSSVALAPGVFSRIYHFSDVTYSVAYHTPSRTVSLLTGDSAEVWWRIFSGDLDAVRTYMLANGSFTDNPEAEAEALLNQFLISIEESNLIEGARNTPTTLSPTATLRETVDPTLNPEQQIQQLMADRHILYSLVLEITYRCNERCIHCYLPEDTRLPELTLDQIDKLLAEFVAQGGFQLLLTGGEVGVRRDFSGILALAKKYGLVTSINSNLTCMTDSLIADIINLHPKSVACSIYSARAELHDAITQVPGSFSKSISTIRRLREAGVPVALKAPLMKSTAEHWRDIEALADELGCGFQMDLTITARNDGGLSPLAQRVDDPAVLRDIYTSRHYSLTIMDEPVQLPQVALDQDANICGAGAGGLCISPDGAIRPCIGIAEAIGRFPQDTLFKVWTEAPFFARWAALRLRDVPCGKCDSFSSCSRCPGAWHAEHGSYTKPTPYNCFLSSAWHSALPTG